MRGVFVNCPNKDCKKMLMKDVYLRPGSHFTFKCYYCGFTITISAEVGIIKTTIVKREETEELTDDEEDDTFFLST